jgi:hypothetical protein
VIAENDGQKCGNKKYYKQSRANMSDNQFCLLEKGIRFVPPGNYKVLLKIFFYKLPNIFGSNFVRLQLPKKINKNCYY